MDRAINGVLDEAPFCPDYIIATGFRGGQAPGSVYKRRSRGLEIGCGGLAAPPVGLNVESEFLTFDEAAHSGALYRRNMNEDIGAAAVLLNEAEAFLRVEELDSAGSHFGLLETLEGVC
jgi:hypothetical protein